ncbi:response regulator [Paenibacillus zeisoli]|uniref:Response regulator n=1 Tax=Paenibacillus zeisoli TaxID=2496267 RepID=A0A3S1D9A9_9BACL|nr:response regulator [Paenibacillus zeisoli]RUT35607.1 response regulator [Paenibacillus zeisoli]
MKPLYRVLIADDEPIIREGIRDSVEWEKLGMEVVGEAEDGEEALELAEKYGIDILLVDMNMPFMDGITLMKRLRVILPECRYVIITGHDEFSYAQEGIRLGVEDYILKPVNTDHLQRVLEHLANELDSVHQQNRYLKAASDQIEKNIPLLRERFCLEWIEGQLTEEEIYEQLQFLQLPGDIPRQLGIVRWPEMSASQPLTKESDRQLFLFALENIVSELLQHYERVMFRDTGSNISICLWEIISEEKIAEIERAAQQYLKIAVNVHFEEIHEEIGAIGLVYKTCLDKVYKESQLSPLVRRARQYIHDYYHDPDLTLEVFARTLQVSPVYLSRMLKKELGTSFVGFIMHLRIRRAIQLLNSTELTILEIAEQVGYESQHYFSTAFKKVMGVSPNQYRKGAAFSEVPDSR